MNERIKELAKQCYKAGPIGRDGWPEYTTFDEEKFAELIVRECIDQLNIPDVPPPISAGLNLGKVAIKQHFGVTE